MQFTPYEIEYNPEDIHGLKDKLVKLYKVRDYLKYRVKISNFHKEQIIVWNRLIKTIELVKRKICEFENKERSEHKLRHSRSKAVKNKARNNFPIAF